MPVNSSGCGVRAVVLKGLWICGVWALCAGCGGPSTTAPAAKPPALQSQTSSEGPEALERGRASFYADSLAGRPTASGEPYAPHKLTAAHRTLPFGAVVDVVREDGRRVQVKINDRGPFKRDRIIDVSRRAAEMLGMVREGVIEVSVELVSMPPKKRRRDRRP